MDGKINVSNEIETYMAVCKKLNMTTYSNYARFFGAINGNAIRFYNFFKHQALGGAIIRKIIKHCAASNGITVFYENERIATHSLRETVTYMLIEAGVTD